MNKSVNGNWVVGVVRFIRTPLMVVALVFVLIFLGIIMAIVCQLPEIAKYVLIAVFIVMGCLVWRSFWRKAKDEPLTATEQYWIKQLDYTYGSDIQENTRQEEFEQPKVSMIPLENKQMKLLKGRARRKRTEKEEK